MDAIQMDELITDLLEDKIKVPDTVTDPLLREIYGNEILVLKRAVQKMVENKMPPSPDWIGGLFLGMETFARRIQDVQKAGLEAMYKSNKKP